MTLFVHASPSSDGKASEKGSEKILKLIKGSPEISAEELAAIIGISSRAVEKQISALKKKELLKRVGPAKGGHWEVYDD